MASMFIKADPDKAAGHNALSACEFLTSSSSVGFQLTNEQLRRGCRFTFVKCRGRYFKALAEQP